MNEQQHFSTTTLILVGTKFVLSLRVFLENILITAVCLHYDVYLVYY